MKRRIPVWVVILLCVVSVAAGAIILALTNNIHSNDWKDISAYTTHSKISIEEAKALAYKKANANEKNISKLTAKTSVEGGIVVYDIEFVSNGVKYSAEIASTNGDFVEWETDTRQFKKSDVFADIGYEKAKEIALSNAQITENQATNFEIELSLNDGVKMYEVEFGYNNTEYCAKILAADGKLMSWKVEKD